LRVIDRVLIGKEPSQAVLDAVLRESKLVPSDKGLCTELVYGYLRWALRLEWDLGRLLKNPDKLPGEMRLVLGLAAYELAFLRIPAHASVNWAVSRVRNRFGKGLAGVANGVLRAFARDVKQYDDPERYAAVADPVERLGIIHSLPAWVVRLWLEAYGEETALAYMRASSGQAVPALRVNAKKDGAVAVRGQLLGEGQGVGVGSFGAAFPSGAPYLARTLEKKGQTSFQSAAVQEILEELGMPGWAGPVWDACAGRGGKTAAMLERGLNVAAATDLSPGRINALPGELARLGLPVPEAVLEADAATPPDAVPFSNKFATILADVPCSGLGTLSRRPEIRFRRTAADIAELCSLQDTILDAAARHLLPGGQIVYLTCTLNPAENGERVAAFLARHPAFSLRKEWTTPVDTPWNEFFYGAIVS
ncbi:16S rRNA methyltransferase, partial [Desulfovibrio sp. OttesenSCG-928-O18]|nr:16S rRNA methyltransferase [Desulfovibrio sp. OttesenSCG-928-O18]